VNAAVQLSLLISSDDSSATATSITRLFFLVNFATSHDATCKSNSAPLM
jgi:hypothetical protein